MCFFFGISDNDILEQAGVQKTGSKPYYVMGIVNVTPDSFYDGGRHATTDDAVEHALRLVAQGADILDIGGESTRPGSLPVSANEECERVIPVIAALIKETNVPISIDTTKSVVAQSALDAGASFVNDVSGGRFDIAMPAVIAKHACRVILMHSRETPKTMQIMPAYHDVVAEVISELKERLDAFVNSGVARENIILDPGIGFAKRVEDNCALMNRIADIVALGFPVCIGTSRKSFIGTITGQAPDDRLAGSLASAAAAFYNGVTFFRVHDVAQTSDLLKVLFAIRCEGKQI